MSAPTRTPPPQLPLPLLRTLLSAVAANRPARDAVDLLRRAGYDAGEGLHALLKQRAGQDADGATLDALSVDRFWDEFASFWEELGWGTLRHERLHPGVAELVGDGWAEADAAPDELGCQLTTGAFADLLSRVAGDDVAVLEVECRGRGDAHCRFLVGAPATLSALYGSLREGETTERSLARLA